MSAPTVDVPDSPAAETALPKEGPELEERARVALVAAPVARPDQGYVRVSGRRDQASGGRDRPAHRRGRARLGAKA